VAENKELMRKSKFGCLCCVSVSSYAARERTLLYRDPFFRLRYATNQYFVGHGVLCLQERANYDIKQLHSAIVRDAVLLYGKNVDVETVHSYLHNVCAFKVGYPFE
jgi:hypothetical protein